VSLAPQQDRPGADGGRPDHLPVVLEPLRWWDIGALADLELLLFRTDSPWTAEMFWSELAAGHHYVVHRNASGAVDGYAGLSRGDEVAEVRTLGVRPDAQRSGVGRALLEDLLRASGDRRVLLEVRTDNEPALALYRSCGFTRIGLRRNYYWPSGADAFTMERPIQRRNQVR
jgi:ribosomal-protein-alanine N-acetyltransferase